MSEPNTEERVRPRLSLPISRQRLIELAVVVFGVLIALGLENLVEEVRLRGDARKLEEAFRRDIVVAIQYGWERQLLDGCLKSNIAALNARVVSGGAWDAAPPAAHSSVALMLPSPYRAPVRLWTTASFDRAIGTDAFKRIPRERANAYAVLFASIASRREANLAEYAAAARLAPLASPMTGIDAEVQVEMLQAVSEMDRYRALALLQAEQFQTQVMAMPGNRQIRAEVLQRRRGYEEVTQHAATTHGECVDRGATDRLMSLVSG